MFFVLSLFALLLMVFYRKNGRYAHHLVFSFYFFAFIFTAFSFIVGFNFITDVPDWIDTFIVFSIFIYLIIALKHFYQQSWIKSLDRKSTRLNSSHVKISYAVFCLKKKNKKCC